jgi:hypothetical protein
MRGMDNPRLNGVLIPHRYVAMYGTSTIGLMNFGSSRDERGRWPRTNQAVNQVAQRETSNSSG